MGGPCFECKDRHYNCHSSCKKYKQYKNKLDIARKKRNKNNDYKEYLRDTKERVRRGAL